mgnify:CR=1 FL=1
MQNAIALPFSFDSSGLVNHTNDEKKIWQDRVAMVIMTNLGERVMRPNFGSEVPQVAFESIGAAQTLITQSVESAFAKHLPSLSLIKVTFEIDPIDFYLVAEIHYRYGPVKNSESAKLKTAVLTRAGDIIVEAN